MKLKSKPAQTAALTLFLLVLLACGAAWAADSNDFLARFAHTNDSTPVNGEVFLTFSTDLYNFFGEDVQGAVAELRGFTDPNAIYATFSPVAIVNQDAVRLAANIAIPTAEYAAWQQGDDPTLTISFVDAAGTNLSTTTTMARTVILIEEGQL